MALRQFPSELATTYVAQVSETQYFWEDQSVTAYQTDTEFEILEEGIGYKCHWDRVRIGNVEGYFHNSYTERLTNTVYIEYECEEKEDTRIQHEQEWKTKCLPQRKRWLGL